MWDSEEGRVVRNADIMQADRAGLVDIRDVHIDRTRPVEERIREYTKQVSDPLLVKCGDYVIKFGYADTEKSLEDRMMEYAAKMAEIRFQTAEEGR